MTQLQPATALHLTVVICCPVFPVRWPVLPAAAVPPVTAGIHAFLGASSSAGAYGALPNPDQLADVFRSSHITPPAARSVQGSISTAPYILPMGGSMLMEGAIPSAAAGRGFLPTATTAAGHAASEAPLLLASPVGASVRPLQVVPPQGAMMFGPDGQPVYYMHPAQVSYGSGGSLDDKGWSTQGAMPMRHKYGVLLLLLCICYKQTVHCCVCDCNHWSRLLVCCVCYRA